MKVKAIKFYADSIKNLENRLNEELKGWKMTRIVKIDVSERSYRLNYRVLLIGEINE